MDLQKFPAERYAAYAVLLTVGVLFFRFLAMPLLFAALPFLLAFAAAYACRPLAIRLHRRTGISVGILCAALIFFFLLVLSVGLFFAVRGAAGELLSLGNRLLGNGDPATDLAHAVSAWWSGVTARFPILAGLLPQGDTAWQDLLLSRLGDIGTRVGEYALAAAGKLAQALPLWFLFFCVTLVAAFYFARDMDKMRAGMLALLPPRAARAVLQAKDGAWQAAVGYLRAYLILMLLTFALLLVGFLLLSLPYALLLSALFALLDLLPVLGVGLFLVPWAIVELLLGNVFRGVGLLILYAVIALAKQIAEPHLVGRGLGLHPLIATAAGYIGFRFFGFAGLLLFPPLCLLLRVFFPSEAAEPGDGKG